MRSEAALNPYRLEFADDFRSLAREELEAMAAAGEQVLEVHRVLAKTSDNVVGELLRDHETFYEWDHYPPGDVYDHETHSQYYYHAHAEAERFPDEHGHFHTFLRPKGFPPGIKPAKVPNYVAPKDPDDALTHFIAIAMTREGLPYRLFTVNRWVTGEVWYEGADVCALLERFDIDHARPSWPVNRWITGLLRAFRPQILALIKARDLAVAAWAEDHPDRDVYEDRELEVTSFLDISIEDQVRKLAAALLEKN